MNSQNRVVLLGQLGSGKTTLYNKITNSGEVVRSGGSSVTQEVKLKTSAYGEGFQLMDTPGFGAENKVLLHSAKIIAALTEGPVSRILILVKFQNRVETILKLIQQIVECCENFIDLVTVAVTHWDQVLDNQNNYNYNHNQGKIRQALSEILISSVIFTSIDDSGFHIAHQIDDILKLNKSRQLEFTFGQIYKQFELIKVGTDQEEKIEVQRSKIYNKFCDIAKIYSKFINDFPVDQYNVIDVMHAITLTIKEEANACIKLFEQENGEQLNKWYDESGKDISYLHDIILKKKIWPRVLEIAKKAQQKIKKSGAVIFHNLRRCPHCQLIWMKVDGCNGKVTCGDVPKQAIDDALHSESLPTKINFRITGNQLEVIYENQNDQSLQQQEQYIKLRVQQNSNQLGWKIKNFFSSDPQFKMDQSWRQKKEDLAAKSMLTRNSIQTAKYGCGKQFTWTDQIPIDDQTLMQLIDPNLFEFFLTEMTDTQIQVQGIEKTYNQIIQEEIVQQQLIIKNLKENDL